MKTVEWDFGKAIVEAETIKGAYESLLDLVHSLQQEHGLHTAICNREVSSIFETCGSMWDPCMIFPKMGRMMHIGRFDQVHVYVNDSLKESVLTLLGDKVFVVNIVNYVIGD
jgi:hypothetical protein